MESISEFIVNLNRKSIGASGIWKECYAQISLGTFDFMHIYVWKTAYIGLTKRGEICLLSSMIGSTKHSYVKFNIPMGKCRRLVRIPQYVRHS